MCFWSSPTKIFKKKLIFMNKSFSPKMTFLTVSFFFFFYFCRSPFRLASYVRIYNTLGVNIPILSPTTFRCKHFNQITLMKKSLRKSFKSRVGHMIHHLVSKDILCHLRPVLTLIHFLTSMESLSESNMMKSMNCV